MMQLVNLKKEIILPFSSKGLIEVNIPLEDEIEVKEDVNDLVMNVWANLTEDNLRNAIKRYEEGKLPNKFLYSQEYIITDNLPSDTEYSYFDNTTEKMYFNIYAINGLNKHLASADAIFGLAMGDKIFKYIDKKAVLIEIQKILRKYQDAIIKYLSENDILVNETMIDSLYYAMIPAICGFIYLDNSESEKCFLPIVPKDRKLELKRTVLKNIYKI